MFTEPLSTVAKTLFLKEQGWDYTTILAKSKVQKILIYRPLLTKSMRMMRNAKRVAAMSGNVM